MTRVGSCVARENALRKEGSDVSHVGRVRHFLSTDLLTLCCLTHLLGPMGVGGVRFWLIKLSFLPFLWLLSAVPTRYFVLLVCYHGTTHTQLAKMICDQNPFLVDLTAEVCSDVYFSFFFSVYI